MDQFMKLPPGQKAAVLAAILAVIGLGMYFLLVDPQLGRVQAATANVRKNEKEKADLQMAASPEELVKLRKQNDDISEKNKEAKKMLPPSEEVPDLIDTIQADAVRSGLQVKRFERLTDEPQDQYTAIPIRMDVEGKMNDLIRFMRIYAGTERRVVHLKNLSVEQQKPDPALLIARQAQSGSAKKQTKTDEDKLLAAIETAEFEFETVTVRATFTAYAYTWTGKPAPGNAGGQKAVKRRT